MYFHLIFMGHGEIEVNGIGHRQSNATFDVGIII